MATYDHHCPWVGNCIAERNRRIFFIFLLAQVTEAVWALALLFDCFEPHDQLEEWLIDNLFTLLSLVICVFFIVMVGSLVFIHSYLAQANLTTWEWLSWGKISYMKVWPKKYGSPFAQGRTRWENVKLYFSPEKFKSSLKQNKKTKRASSRYIQWEMPTSFPELAGGQSENKSVKKEQ